MCENFYVPTVSRLSSPSQKNLIQFLQSNITWVNEDIQDAEKSQNPKILWKFYQRLFSSIETVIAVTLTVIDCIHWGSFSSNSFWLKYRCF